MVNGILNDFSALKVNTNVVKFTFNRYSEMNEKLIDKIERALCK